jgi:hypothetical protein
VRTHIGTCSICAGTVSVPTVYMSVVPPTPTCERCGAHAAPSGPVIPMQAQPHVTIVSTTNGAVRIVSDPRTPENGFALRDEWRVP